MDIQTTKLIVLATLFVVTFVFCMLPLKLAAVIQQVADPRKKSKYKMGMSMLNCFAGGVFLGTCLLDLFPEVHSNMNEALEKLKIEQSFPVSEVLVAFGLFLVLITEQITLSCKESAIKTPARSRERESLLPPVQPPSIQVESTQNPDEIYVETRTPSYGAVDNSNHSHSHSVTEETSALRALLLLLALSLHSVFEGLAIGLQPIVEEVLQVFVAVVLHKCIIAFSLSLQMTQSGLRTLVVVSLMLVFSLAAPFGLAIGIGVTQVSTGVEAMLISGILQGLACGTFLFVTFFEVLPHELNNSDYRLPKLLFILLGFAAACGIVYLDPDTDETSCGTP